MTEHVDHDDFDPDVFEYQLDGALMHDGTGTGEQTGYVIGQALRRLPDDVRDFAARGCLFLPTGNASHYLSLEKLAMQRELDRKWLVLIHRHADQSDEDIESLVAHEVAHLWLGHAEYGIVGTEEIDAAALVVQWGFSGSGTEPSWLPEDRLGKRQEL